MKSLKNKFERLAMEVAKKTWKDPLISYRYLISQSRDGNPLDNLNMWRLLIKTKIHEIS